MVIVLWLFITTHQILLELLHSWGHIDIFPACSAMVAQEVLRTGLGKSGCSAKPHSLSFSLMLSSKSGTQRGPAAGCGSLMAAEERYWCISERFPGFGC